MHSRLRCPIAALTEGSRAVGVLHRGLSGLEERADLGAAGGSGPIAEGVPIEFLSDVLGLPDAVLPHLHNDTAR